MTDRWIDGLIDIVFAAPQDVLGHVGGFVSGVTRLVVFIFQRRLFLAIY